VIRQVGVFGISGKTGLPRSFRLHIIITLSLFCGILKCSVLRITAYNTRVRLFYSKLRSTYFRCRAWINSNVFHYQIFRFMFFNYFTNIKEESPSVCRQTLLKSDLLNGWQLHNCIFHDITIVVFNLKIIHGYFGRLSFVISNGAYHT
jgi:hypothetical protein